MDLSTNLPFESLDDAAREQLLDALAGDGPDLGVLLLELGNTALEQGKTKLANNLFNSALYQEQARGRPGGEIAVESLKLLVDTAVRMRERRAAANWASQLSQVAPDDRTRNSARRRATRLRSAMAASAAAESASGPKHVATYPLSTFEPRTVKRLFADVGGLAEAKDALNRVAILPRRNQQSAHRFGISAGGGVLLYGPPGCGKTLVAEAAAGELDVPLIEVCASEILHPLYGMAERNIAEAFETAAKNSPCVLFFDEIDGIAQRRDTDFFHRSLVNVLLKEMEGAHRVNGVLVIAATNDLERVDPALLRPGRFDKLVPVRTPDPAARHAIWQLQLSRFPLGDDVALELLAELTDGLTGADIAEVATAAAESVWMQSLDEDDSQRVVCLSDVLISLRRGFADGVMKARIDELLAEDLRRQVDGTPRAG